MYRFRSTNDFEPDTREVDSRALAGLLLAAGGGLVNIVSIAAYW